MSKLQSIAINLNARNGSTGGMSVTPYFNPRTRREWLLVCGMILVFSAIAYYAIAFARGVMGLEAPDPEWVLALSSLGTTTIIVLSQIYSSVLAHRLIPPKSRKAAVIHILMQALSVVVAFVAANRLEQAIRGQCTVPTQLLLWICMVTFMLSLIGNGGFYFLYFQRQVQSARRAVLQSELVALRAQINPHFLFNTLNSIAALIRINPERAENVTELLADLFRYSLRSSKVPLVSLREEFDSILLYLRIEEARFGDRLHYRCTLPKELEDCRVPSLILQPLVENAVKHGAQHSESPFHLNVEAIMNTDEVCVRVEDSGPGFANTSPESLYERGTGLVNVRDRLLLLFAHRARVEFEAQAVLLYFPAEQLESRGMESHDDSSYARRTAPRV